MEEFILRKATIHDVPFLVDTIIEAEKSGSEILSYTAIFGLTEDEARKYITVMLQEEIDGCEFSISSFLIAEINGEIAASVAAWIEGSEGVSSVVLKGNLLNFVLPKHCIERAIQFSSILKDLNIEYVMNTIQIGVVFVASAFRGRNLVGLLIDEQLQRLTKNNLFISDACVQVFGNNTPAIRAYEKVGFQIQQIKEASNKKILQLLPSDKKILMCRKLLTNKN